MFEGGVKGRGVEAVEFEDFIGGSEAGCDAYRGGMETGELGEEADDGLVGLAVDRRGGHSQLPGIAMPSGKLRSAGSGIDFQGDPGLHGMSPGFGWRDFDQRMSARKSVTPAAMRWETTSKVITSSSQSWLEPSRYWVATVIVY